MPIPYDFKSIFWDTAIQDLDLKKHRKYIIERILNFGDLEHFSWLLKNYTPEEIIDEVKTNRQINKKSAILVANFFNIDKEEIFCSWNA
ncbi:hypothetical protein SAMN02745221_00214 [Thermosyntropha lipolytica DSM 11003]|uniref:DUF6922 domain-containing protein n=1 Tax=Thermosyntropha lipolytica DSM 11003 TaxID=1123382 RepID=A0A1M5JSN7_9FIRM|nr:hypothetical protein [Thermosyntropha lipolytica]SHG43622.1 hypothetical protein SAMN02745221_00214 [Thermosyntropha lipolytica DSM 11003]